jgi:hypothetical protein
MDKKLEAINAYTTQFTNKDESEPQTYISSPDFLESIVLPRQDVWKNDRGEFCGGFH